MIKILYIIYRNLSGMSSEESLSTRLRPGVTTRLSKAKGTNNLQDDLMRLIDPDIAESDLAGILVKLYTDYWLRLCC
jgi:hypothetical protein